MSELWAEWYKTVFWIESCNRDAVTTGDPLPRSDTHSRSTFSDKSPDPVNPSSSRALQTRFFFWLPLPISGTSKVAEAQRALGKSGHSRTAGIVTQYGSAIMNRIDTDIDASNFSADVLMSVFYAAPILPF